MNLTTHIVPEYTIGEKCHMCENPAQHKVEEVIECFDKAGQVSRHPFSAYLCCRCFSDIMGIGAEMACGFRIPPNRPEDCDCALWCLIGEHAAICATQRGIS